MLWVHNANMRVVFTFSTFFIFLVLGSSLAYACSCSDPSQRQRFRAADAVFVGEVLEYKELTELEHKELTKADTKKDLESFFYQVTFKIEKQWKGKRQSEITALADFDDPGNCNDLDLSVGKRILVYAPREQGQFLIYRDCGPNRTAEYAKNEIKRLSNFLFQTYIFFYPYPKL